MTTVGAVIKMAGRTFSGYIHKPLAETLSRPTVAHVFNNIKLSSGVPNRQILIVQAIHD